ncbi:MULTISPECIES: hypothetical protein [Bacillus cereus group]|nr:hypothetical protein [Bacillus mycoides]
MIYADGGTICSHEQIKFVLGQGAWKKGCGIVSREKDYMRAFN